MALPHYYCNIIDNLLSQQECAALIALAQSDQDWSQAALHYGLAPSQHIIDTDYRNSQRILRFDHATAASLFQKLLPHTHDIQHLASGSDSDSGFGRAIIGPNVNGNYTLLGLNERLTFLRYGPGNYFRKHCDAQLHLPDGRTSLLTLQIYLGEPGLQGGATRFWSASDDYYYDVQPLPGRALIFQQRGLWHSGEDVVQGQKYALRTDFMFVRDPL